MYIIGSVVTQIIVQRGLGWDFFFFIHNIILLNMDDSPQNRFPKPPPRPVVKVVNANHYVHYNFTLPVVFIGICTIIM